MKYSMKFGVIVITSIVFISCKKESEAPQIAAVNVVNAAINAGSVKVNYFGTPTVWATYTGAAGTVNFSASKLYALPAGNAPLTIVPTTDTLTPIYNNSITVAGGDVYSLYLAGQSPTFESLVIKDAIPARYTDSTIGIRIINLSPNSTPVNITLASATTTNVFTDVAYKQITGFVKFPTPTTTPANNVTFQARNAAGTLLASYVIPTSAAAAYPGISVALSRFKNLTLVIKGLQGTTTGTNAFGVFPVANY